MSNVNTLLTPPSTSSMLRKKYTVKVADIIAGGAFTTVDIVLEEFPAGFIHEASRIQHTTALVGATGPITAGTARLKLVTTAASPITTQLGAGALDIFTAPGILDGTSSVTSVTKVAGDLDLTTKLVMTVTETGATTGLSDATAGEIVAWCDHQFLG